ncbi:response regulator [cf. Phormidesmis sp. LEGE 11477]|uniref:response regulator n=1 Tax=cf. Phormidesmis sp. LEGE 11477 TaxID=1828680 RepID=UPI00187F5376|nr:response regulator [cf. Phormidesmis sp. LEGE 11477]MBE9060634.1 response regulator [cf. Phormidesmis sp. LEGE 11477]
MPKQILIVDDDEGIREVIQFSLESKTDWSIWAAAAGKEGIAIAQSQPLDLILLDVVMPEEDGIAVYQQLQAGESTRTIPVILLTANARSCDHKAFINLGVNGIIAKPFKCKRLVETITQLLGW